MGLLDFKMPEMESPEGQGLLAAAFNLMGAKGNSFGNALGSAGRDYMATYGTARNTQEAAQLRNIQMEQARLQMQEMKRKTEEVERQRQWSAKLPEVMGQKVYGSSDLGPTMQPDNAALQNYLLSPESPYRDKLIEKSLFPEKPESFTLGEGQVRYQGNQIVAQGPAKAPDLPSAVKEYEYARNQGYKGTFNDFQIAQKRAGASSQTVINEGQKGLDNTLKVRADFRSEPIYKAHGEVQAAHAQISTALKQNSPAGDLAGATKFMKILDPGSVVRESELGMAMAAGGLIDRAQNYANMAIRGEKLTPAQRKDFQNLADSLLRESANQYSAKRSEYKGIAERNQLSVPDILGPEPKQPPVMDALPSPVQHKGKTIRDTTTGKVLRSDGMTWKEVSK